MMLIGVATMCMTSCRKDELPAEDAWILGRWYMELNKKGTLGTDSLRYEYTKVVLCGDFGEKYEGFWSLIYVDSANHAISPNGDSYWANCRYTVQDKTVRLNLNPSYLPMAQKEWTLTYEGDEWTLLDEQKDNFEWIQEWFSLTTKFNVCQKKPWQYYRLEVSRLEDASNNSGFVNFKFLY